MGKVGIIRVVVRIPTVQFPRQSGADIEGVAAEGLAQFTTGIMRPVWWVSVFIVISAFALWIVLYSSLNLQDNPVASRIAFGYFLFLSVGPYWMVYDCWHYDKRFTRKMWLFFVPGGFLWYYFERFRPRQIRKRLRLSS